MKFFNYFWSLFLKIWNYLNSHILFVLILISLIPIGFYIYNFGGCDFSKDPNDWGVFGDYIGGVYSVVITILVVYISRNLEKRDEEKRYKKEKLRAVYMQITSIQQKPEVNQNKLTKL